MQVSDDTHGKLYLPRRLKIILGAILCLFAPSIYINAGLRHKLLEFVLNAASFVGFSDVQVMRSPTAFASNSSLLTLATDAQLSIMLKTWEHTVPQ